MDFMQDLFEGDGLIPNLARLCLTVAMIRVLTLIAKKLIKHVLDEEERKKAASSSPSGAAPAATAADGTAVGAAEADVQPLRRMLIAHATLKGTARGLSHKLFSSVIGRRFPENFIAPPKVMDLKDVDADALHEQDIVVFFVSTYEGGKAPEPALMFSEMLQSIATDFRYPRDHFAKVNFAIFGLGDTVYGHDFNKFAKDLVDWLKSRGAKFFVPPVFANEKKVQPLSVLFSNKVMGFLEKQYSKVENALSTIDDSSTAAPTESQVETDTEHESDDDDAMEDLEDMVGDVAAAGNNELLYPRLRANLSKQGYELIGSHSGVKLCRWTKSMLRGRGGCYKHTFYNISSYQCMEMTPSLACANKCVFCWRHHTNPVSKEFKWKIDPPEFLVENAILGHQKMIKQARGIPGVQPDRFQEAMNIKHCALSLVGEPIMYPRINEFLDELHKRRISSFMVTNAQFPEQIKNLRPVTQLYVSIDAPTRDELQRIDRPLFEDFWERCLACIYELSLKRQRTVFRLTLVDGYNMENVLEYAKLVRLGKPDFIEVKGVTYCGDSGASSLTMKNIPFHDQVIAFCGELAKAIGGPSGELEEPEYAVACEHEHSCCVLMAIKKKFFFKNQWHTWIDYDKFFELVESGNTSFDALDYALPTPDWAIAHSNERGFDPKETRVKRNKPMTSGC